MLSDTNTLALSRRSFLVTTGAFSVAVAFGPALDTRHGRRRIQSQRLGHDRRGQYRHHRRADG